MDIKKGLLWMGLGAIGFTGICSALFFLFGSFGETAVRLLASTLTLGWYGMAASLSLRLGDGVGAKVQNGFAVVVCALGLFVGLHLIWASNGLPFLEWGFKKEFELIFTFFSLSFTLLWFSRLVRSAADSQMVAWCSMAATGLVCIGELMILILIWSEGRDLGDFFYRLLAVVTVLGVTGTVARMILRKISSPQVTLPS